MKRIEWILCLILCFLLILTGCGKKDENELDKNNPVKITVWNYYNGAQLEVFNDLVDKFNKTVGEEKGIIVETYSHGSINDLKNNVIDSINGKAGAEKVPNIFAAYADTAYEVDKLGKVADIEEYFTKDELSEYMDSYIEEGYFTKDGGLKIFPIAKSTEILMLNYTDWKKFSEATGTDENDLSTFEGIARTAEKYYNWTDSLTDEPNDGKAFFGRDAMANYFIIGFRQHGKEIFEVNEDGSVTLNFDEEIVRKLWDNYYVPYIKGYFASSGRFRSDDIKTGNIISFIGSSSGATFFPKEVNLNDTESYMIENEVRECPIFEGQQKAAVQQGAGMVVIKASKREEAASLEFLKWFTQDEQNIEFAVSSGYMPVKKSANDIKKVNKYINTDDDMVQKIVEKGISTVKSSSMYTTKVFENATEARNILEYSLSDKSKADRDTVIKNINDGMTLEEAEAEFLNDENFKMWYEKTKSELENVVEQN